MDSNKLHALRDMLDGLEGDSLDVDAEIANLLQPLNNGAKWVSVDGFCPASVTYECFMRYTSSVDDALALVERVLPGWLPALIMVDARTWEAELESPIDAETFASFVGRSPTPAMAICRALVAALIAQEEPTR